MYKILVAEDERIERQVLVKTLQTCMGDICEIFEAKNGKEALEVFEKEHIQIAILDIEMPGISGLEAAKQMRKRNEHCVILFLTAYDEFSYAKQAITLQALDYILKPYEENELVYAVEEATRLADKNEKIRTWGIFSEKEEHMEESAEEVRLSIIKEKIADYIELHYAEELSIHKLANWMNYSENYFSKLFKQCFRVNFTAYLVNYRVEIAKELLSDFDRSVKEVGKACGYEDSNYFTRIFKRVTGCTPTEYRTKRMIQKRS